MQRQDSEAILGAFARRVAESEHNLVSRRARGEVVSRHIPESLAVAEDVAQDARSLMDIGSGGGFPGFVIAVHRRDLDVHLVESSQKKAEFLRRTAESLAVPVTVHAVRAEQLATTPLAASFDVVTARAVASLRNLLAITVPFLRAGGQLLAVKGERWRAELEAAEDELQRWGLEVASTPTDAASSDASPRIVRLRRKTIDLPRRRSR